MPCRSGWEAFLVEICLAVKLARRRTEGKLLTSEEITAKHRAARKQFKLDRARAVAAVAVEAELAFAERRVISPALSGPPISSAATWKPTPSEEPPGISATVPVEDDDAEHLKLTLSEALLRLFYSDSAVVVSPVDPADRESSFVDLQNSPPFTWSWHSTIDRVNSPNGGSVKDRIPKSMVEACCCEGI